MLKNNEINEILITEEEIENKITELGKKISQDYKDKNLILIGILRGAVIFMADLARAISIPMLFDFIAISSYGAETKSSGVVRILKDLDVNIEGKDVLIKETCQCKDMFIFDKKCQEKSQYQGGLFRI